MTMSMLFNFVVIKDWCTFDPKIFVFSGTELFSVVTRHLSLSYLSTVGNSLIFAYSSFRRLHFRSSQLGNARIVIVVASVRCVPVAVSCPN